MLFRLHLKGKTRLLQWLIVLVEAIEVRSFPTHYNSLVINGYTIVSNAFAALIRFIVKLVNYH